MQIWWLVILLGTIFVRSEGNELPLQVNTGGGYDYKTTLAIMGDRFHTSCKLCAGDNLTMIYCADSFEVYQTDHLI